MPEVRDYTEAVELELQLPTVVCEPVPPEITKHSSDTARRIEQSMETNPTDDILTHHKIDTAQFHQDMREYFRAIQTSAYLMHQKTTSDNLVQHLLTDQAFTMGDMLRDDFFQNLHKILSYNDNIEKNFKDIVKWMFVNVIIPQIQQTHETYQTHELLQNQEFIDRFTDTYKHLGSTTTEIYQNLLEFFYKRFAHELHQSNLNKVVHSV